MLTQLTACVVTGQEPDLDGVCPEHGETACLVSVGAPPERFIPLQYRGCEIPGYQCTGGHDGAVPPVDTPPAD